MRVFRTKVFALKIGSPIAVSHAVSFACRFIVKRGR